MTATFTGKFSISRAEIKVPVYTILKIEKLYESFLREEILVMK